MDLMRAHFLIWLIAVATASPAATADSLGALLCQKRKPCRVTARHSAGTNAAGRMLAVVEVALHERTDDWKQPSLDGCAPYELWLVEGKGRALSTRLLLSLCNDGYGASGVGDDSVSVGTNRLSYGQSGGSAWRWSRGYVLQLSPLEILEESWNGYWNIGSNFEDGKWSWRRHEGQGTWYSPRCQADGTPPSDEDAPIDGHPDAQAFALIPDVRLPKALAGTGWRSTPLGSCALSIDASGKGGFVTHGRPGAPSDASMKVLSSEGTLYVEITDDRWVRGKSWLYDDHVELWLSEIGGYGEPCVGTRAKQWGIRIADGAVFAASGAPKKAPNVETQFDPGQRTARLKITLPAGYGRMTVVYSDSDDGKRQERLIATSALRRRSELLGRVFALGDKAQCVVAPSGRLEMQNTHRFTNAAVISP